LTVAGATITALTAARALEAMGAAGLDPGVEARRLGLPEIALPPFELRVSLGRVEALFQRGVERIGPDFPLLARPLRPEENRSTLGLYCRTRPTIREGLRSLCEHFALVTDGYGMALDETAAGATLRWVGPPSPHVWWFDAADAFATLRSVRPTAPWVEAVTSPFPAPPGAGGLFGAEIRRGPSFALELSRAVLDQALPPVDPAIRAHVERSLRSLRAPEHGAAGLVTALWALGPTATVSELARVTGTSERTAHRRLAEAGTSFRAELDRVRAALATASRGRPEEDLATLLGYSDVRAYRRAARRWRQGQVASTE
jgi:AraC-like DNA-binding protein